MPVVALVVIAVWMVLVGGVRTWLHLRAGANCPIRFVGSPQWRARLLGALAFLLLVLAPIAELAGLPPVDDVGPSVRLAGLGLALIGIVGILSARRRWAPRGAPTSTRGPERQ